MWSACLIGGGFGFAAAVQPGPFLAFLFARVTAAGWKRTWPACFAPLLSDGPIAAAALLLLHRLPPAAHLILQGVGGLYLVCLAALAFRLWRRPAGEPAQLPTAPRTLLDAALINLLNPNPYLAWAFVLGPAVHTAWRAHPLRAVALITAFYGVMLASLAVLLALAGTVRLLDARPRRALNGLSAGLLAALGVALLLRALLAWQGA